MNQYITTFSLYLVIIFILSIISFLRTKNSSDYLLAGRLLSGPIVALGVGASDMSAWLMLAIPGLIMLYGLNHIWLPLSALIGGYLNWQFIAKRLRIYTKIANDALTIPAYFEERFSDHYGILGASTAIAILIFFTFYTAAGFVSWA
ncbi:MAG: hypothetical protein GY821_18015 [Gammaproteobacteria bacterium]|nr:hypothetical protein [Gammaproteobacteria bacterium]